MFLMGFDCLLLSECFNSGLDNVNTQAHIEKSVLSSLDRLIHRPCDPLLAPVVCGVSVLLYPSLCWPAGVCKSLAGVCKSLAGVCG